MAEAKLSKSLPMITTQHAAEILAGRGFTQTRGLRTWDEARLSRDEQWLKITSLPGEHARDPVMKAMLPPVMGSMLEWGQSGSAPFRLYISGDTLVGDHLREIPRRYPDINLALLHLGGTRVLGVLVTMDAEQGIEAIHIVNPHKVIPIHYNDYEVFKSTLEEFMEAVDKAGLTDRVHYLNHGDIYWFEMK